MKFSSHATDATGPGEQRRVRHERDRSSSCTGERGVPRGRGIVGIATTGFRPVLRETRQSRLSLTARRPEGVTWAAARFALADPPASSPEPESSSKPLHQSANCSVIGGTGSRRTMLTLTTHIWSTRGKGREVNCRGYVPRCDYGVCSAIRVSSIFLKILLKFGIDFLSPCFLNSSMFRLVDSRLDVNH